jgi:transposase
MSTAQLVFVDETWATTNMARRYGRSPRGQRMVASVPPSDRSAVCPSGGSLRDGHWQTSTFVAGLRQDGIMAPCVLDGAINGRSFRAWIEQFLAPTLRAGDIVVLDNLSSHRVDGVRQAIEASGATMRHLPPYSPDLNPIEQTFAKLKAHLRRIAARSRETLWASMSQVLDTITPTECQNYIANAGYGST